MSNEKYAYEQYWAEANYLPFEVVLEWCKKEPDNFEARKHAVISACQKKIIKYDYEDPRAEDHYVQYLNDFGKYADWVEFLVSQKDLLIERASFLEWINSLKEDKHATPPIYNFKAEQTLLKIIGALITIHYDRQAFKIGEKPNASAIEEAILGKLKRSDGLKDGTIRKKIPFAIDAIKENLSTW